MIKTQILLWKTIKGNRRLKVRLGPGFFCFILYSPPLTHDVTCSRHCLHRKNEEEMSDEQPPYVIESRSELGSKSYIFTEIDKIISLTNLFQHLLSAEILFE